MSGSGEESRWRTFRAGLPGELRAWAATDGVKWLFVFKIILAVLLSMWISMWLELDRPGTAMITVVIVMQQQTGLVLGKSLYRIGGTLAGTLAGLALVGLFAQQRFLFLAGLALWILICTTGAVLLRNLRSYGSVLAGYTAAIIGLPVIDQPQAFFSTASTRISEIVVGILCAGVVNDVIFPQRFSDSIAQRLRKRYADFATFMRGIFRGDLSAEEYERTHLKFVADAINLEALRSSAILEDAEVRARDLGLRQANSAYMSLSTTLHSLHQLLRRLLQGGGPASQALKSLQGLISGILPAETGAPRTPDEAQQELRRIAAFRATLAKRAAALKASCSGVADRQARLDLDTALELLRRFIRELNASVAIYAALLEGRTTLDRRAVGDIRFSMRTDMLVAVLTGARAAVVILLASAFWIVSAWPSGISALTYATIMGALCGTTSNPVRSSQHLAIGSAIGMVAAFICTFFVVTTLSESFMLLSAAIIPFLLALLCIEQFFPAYALIGVGAATFFLNMFSPSNVAQPSILPFLNDGLASLLGVGVTTLVFCTVVPNSSAWLKRRTLRQVRHQVVVAAREPLDGLLHRFESGTRDTLRTLAATQNVSGAHERHVLASLFASLELGRALINLRQNASTVTLAAPVKRSLGGVLDAVADLIGRPSLGRHGAALTAVTASLSLVMQEEGKSLPVRQRTALRRMVTSLHLIRMALLDDETVLALTTTAPVPHPYQGVPHAA